MAIRLGTESRDKSLLVPTNYRCGVLHTNAQVPAQKGVLNIQNLYDDYCFLWCILGHIHSIALNNKPERLYNHRKYFNELDISGLNFPLKFSNTPKFETLNPSISVNVLVYENNEVFPLYASKHRDRKYHVNLLMISRIEGKFTTCSLGTCPLSYMEALNTMDTRTCVRTPSIASRRCVC